MAEEEDLVEFKFQCERAMMEEFELWCKEHHVDFDETLEKMIDIGLKRLSKQARMRNSIQVRSKC